MQNLNQGWDQIKNLLQHWSRGGRGAEARIAAFEDNDIQLQAADTSSQAVQDFVHQPLRKSMRPVFTLDAGELRSNFQLA